MGRFRNWPAQAPRCGHLRGAARAPWVPCPLSGIRYARHHTRGIVAAVWQPAHSRTSSRPSLTTRLPGVSPASKVPLALAGCPLRRPSEQLPGTGPPSRPDIIEPTSRAAGCFVAAVTMVDFRDATPHLRAIHLTVRPTRAQKGLRTAVCEDHRLRPARFPAGGDDPPAAG